MPTMVEEKMFDSARDKALIKVNTHFYCYGHLSAIPIEKQSDDPRYCRGCCKFLRQEARLQSTSAKWVPKIAKKKAGKKAPIDKAQDAPHTSHVPSVKGDIILRHTSTTPANRPPIMSTITTPKSEVAIIAPGAAVKKRRGPKYKVLPVELIKRWAEEEEMGSKTIAARLGKEYGIEVSYKTIQRILAGKRSIENKEVTFGQNV